MSNFIVDTPHSLPLRKFLKLQFPNISMKSLNHAIEHSSCQLNGKIERFGSTKVKKGDRVVFHDYQSVEAVKEILYEDEELLVLNKPAGIVCHKPILSTWLQRPIYLVHRLDKDTTGVFILLKSAKLMPYFDRLFKNKQISKTYQALVQGKVDFNEILVNKPLAPISYYQGQTTYGIKPYGKSAQTQVTILKRSQQVSLIEAKPFTGRTHQIRAHLKYLGHPIIGDVQYGARDLWAPRTLLHATQLTFIHPLSGKEMRFWAPFPQDFQQMRARYIT